MEIKYPTSFQATDCVIINRIDKTLLLGKKSTEPKYRFIGGFVEPKDDSLEFANIRERIEEVGINLECSFPEYLFSFRVDDPRYKNSVDKIMSAVFLSEYIFGFPTPNDDIAEAFWFKIKDLKCNYTDILMKEHYPIIRKLVENGII